jgi:hypothetical protein
LSPRFVRVTSFIDSAGLLSSFACSSAAAAAAALRDPASSTIELTEPALLMLSCCRSRMPQKSDPLLAALFLLLFRLLDFRHHDPRLLGAYLSRTQPAIVMRRQGCSPPALVNCMEPLDGRVTRQHRAATPHPADMSVRAWIGSGRCVCRALGNHYHRHKHLTPSNH